MPLRDLLLVSALMIVVPMIFVRPHVGTAVWAWTAMLVPNTFLFGFAQSLRFNLIIAVTTIVAWLVSKEPKKIPLNGTSFLLFFFLFWISLATALGVAEPDVRWVELEKLVKIIIFTVMITVLVTTRLRVHTLLFGLCLGLGYHGVAEGAKFILSGGGHHIFGPGASIIGDNNHFALAMTFLLPIIYYLYSFSKNRLVRYGLLGAAGLILVSIIGTHSRGGLIALAAMGMLWGLMSKQKILVLIGSVFFLALVFFLAPEAWFERMGTIQEAGEDGSFMGRVIAWKMSVLLALDRPLIGGGLYAIQDNPTWQYYRMDFNRLSFIPTPPPRETALAAHSIYFQVLGDAGFVGLALFLTILARTWFACGKLMRRANGFAELRWIHALARTFRLSLFAYAVAGAALNMAYFEMLFVLVTLVAILENAVSRHFEGAAADTKSVSGPSPREAMALKPE